MSLVPVIPESAPFTLEQRAWLNGYLAGLFSRGPVAATVPAAGAPVKTLTPLTLLFGSQTGTAENLAKRAAKEAGKRGFAPTVVDMAQTDLSKLSSENNLLVITSTYGDGEPPDNAKPLHAALAAACNAAIDPSASPRLRGVRFSVCALGDTNYVQFCRCGKDLDTFLEKLGATRIAARADCDLDYDAKFTSWLGEALTAFATSPSLSKAAPLSAAATASERDDEPAGYSRTNPFPALLTVSRRLGGESSAKRVHHVEFALENSGLTYEAGDALGVVPHNCPELIDDVLGALGCDGEEAVTAPDGSTATLRRALTEHYDLGKPSPELLALFGGGQQGGVAVALHHVIDVLIARPDIRVAPADFVRALKRLQPRLYSISSSPKAHAGHVHLTVGAVGYEAAIRPRKGVCSTFLADRVVPGESRVGIFVHTNRSFRLPPAGDTPVIMIGPGTGVAPFRAFLHERRATGARGKNWLFFGDQHAASDFLYRDELLAFRSDGLLTRLDLAWSRDQQEKIYVQNRLLEQAAELFAWLEAGAHVYVCGDASRMAKDVDAALHTALQRASGKSAEAVADYVQNLRTTKRYCRDVY